MIGSQCDDVFFALADYSANREVVLQKTNIPLVRHIAALPFLAHCSHPQGKYNPINSGTWQAETIREKLISEIESIQNPEMEQIFPLEMVKERKFWED